MNKLLKTAKKAAREAGKILRDNFGKVARDDIRQKARTDFISYVDEQSEKKIIETIHADFPDHSILAEESGARQLSESYTWIIDPLDGTTNYLKTIPIFAVSIAVAHLNEIVAGVIYNPICEEFFYAAKGEGAYLNDKPIHVSDVSALQESFIATGFPFKLKHKLPDYLKCFEGLFSKSIGARRMGAAAIDLAYVACGRFDAFWEIGLSPWDVAAGDIIIREAGGKISDFWNRNNHIFCSYALASNGKIHDQTGEIIRDVFPFYKSLSKELTQ